MVRISPHDPSLAAAGGAAVQGRGHRRMFCRGRPAGRPYVHPHTSLHADGIPAQVVKVSLHVAFAGAGNGRSPLGGLMGEPLLSTAQLAVLSIDHLINSYEL